MARKAEAMIAASCPDMGPVSPERVEAPSLAAKTDPPRLRETGRPTIDAGGCSIGDVDDSGWVG